MSPIAELELRYDGHIPSGELTQARLEFSQRPRPAATVGKVILKPAGIVESMARTMRVVAGLNGSVMAIDLRAAGFAGDEIQLYVERASQRAAELSERRADLNPVELMADELLEISGRQGSCSERALTARGFTTRDIERYGEAAVLRAAQLSNQRGEA